MAESVPILYLFAETFAMFGGDPVAEDEHGQRSNGRSQEEVHVGVVTPVQQVPMDGAGGGVALCGHEPATGRRAGTGTISGDGPGCLRPRGWRTGRPGLNTRASSRGRHAPSVSRARARADRSAGLCPSSHHHGQRYTVGEYSGNPVGDVIGLVAFHDCRSAIDLNPVGVLAWCQPAPVNADSGSTRSTAAQAGWDLRRSDHLAQAGICIEADGDRRLPVAALPLFRTVAARRTVPVPLSDESAPVTMAGSGSGNRLI